MISLDIFAFWVILNELRNFIERFDEGIFVSEEDDAEVTGVWIFVTES